jgi:hypothetical protein
MELIPEVISENSLSLILKAEIDIQISTAKAFPRSIKTFIDKAISLATVNDNVAASCSYSLPRSGKTLDGPSVRLAEIACSTYGNIRSAARVISNDGKTVTAQGICHDLETNNCVTVEVKRKITDKNGKTFTEDMQVVTGNAACAIAFRNAVFKVIPSALIQEVFDAAKQVTIGTLETLTERRDKALNYFKQLGVTDTQICDVMGIKRVEDIDLEKLYTLRGMVTLIKNGESTIQDLFVKPKKEVVDKEAERIIMMINDAKSLAELNDIKKYVKEPQMILFNEKFDSLSTSQA